MAKSKAKKPERSLRLYVAGNAPNSVRAIANARALCEEDLEVLYALEIVDVLKNPQRAMADGIIVTPTLLRLSPLPVQRIVGDLRDKSQVLTTLSET